MVGPGPGPEVEMKEDIVPVVCLSRSISSTKQHEEQTEETQNMQKKTTPMCFWTSPPPPLPHPFRGWAERQPGKGQRISRAHRFPTPPLVMTIKSGSLSLWVRGGLRGAEGMKHADDPVPGGPLANRHRARTPLRGSPSGLQACIHFVWLLLNSGTAGVALPWLLAGPELCLRRGGCFSEMGSILGATGRF